MAIGRDEAALRQLCTLFDAGTLVGLTDGQLLERFATRSPEVSGAAFAVLVQRHGPMVLRVCRGVLRDDHEAMDAFQATFLVLVKKVRGLWVQDSLGPWLHQVAYRTASYARSVAAQRRRHERRAAEVGVADRACDGGRIDNESEQMLHEELARLPERFRAPLVLCYLEGLTCEEAAQHLRWPVGTVKSRLARGRGRLRGRLTRRGLTGAPLPVEAAKSAVPTASVTATVQAAMRFAEGTMAAGVVSASVTALIEGVLRPMFFTRSKMAVVAVLLACGGAAGVGVLAQQGGTSKPAIRGPQKDAAAPRPPNPNQALAEAQLKLAREAIQDLSRSYEAGRLTLTDPIFALWEHRQVEALRATGAPKAELISALEGHLKRMKDRVALAQGTYKEGRSTRADVLELQYRTLEAEMWLNRERAQ